MYKNKDVDKIKNDICLACEFCVWEEERRRYVCDIKGCYNNSKFKVYTPAWLKKGKDD